MNAIERLECPLCGGNFEQSFECNHDEYDLVDRIEELQSEYQKLARDTENLKKLIAANATIERVRKRLNELDKQELKAPVKRLVDEILAAIKGDK